MTSTPSSAEIPDTLALFSEGGYLSKGKANGYIEILKTDPNNLKARLTLIGFYEKQQGKKGIDAAFGEHLKWLIKTYPKNSIHQHICYVPVKSEPYRTLRREWLKQVRLHQDSCDVLDNAARFF